MYTFYLFLGHDKAKRAGQVQGIFYCVVEHTTDNKYIEHARLAIDSMEFVFRFYGFLMRDDFVYKTAQDRTWRS